METAPSLRFLLCSHIRLELGLRLVQNVRPFLRAQADEIGKSLGKLKDNMAAYVDGLKAKNK